MGLLARAISNLLPPGFGAASSVTSIVRSSGVVENYAQQAYAGNEIVYAAVKLLMTSAAEPHIIGRRWRRDKRQAKVETRMLALNGITNRAGARMADGYLISNGFFEEVDHMLVDLLNNPNPWTSRGQLWGAVVADRLLAGNAYLYKVRAKAPFRDIPVELWRLRPDRVTIIPSKENVIEAYEYKTADGVVRIAPRDIIHIKEFHPLDEFYGMSVITAIMGRIAIDNFQRNFLKSFYEKGGTGPGAILSTKNRMTQEDKDDTRTRLKKLLGGVNGFHETLILDNAEGTTFTQMGLDRGLRDALPKEIDAVNEARIAMAFGIPGSILGLLIGYESSSYANKRQDWQVLWDVTMTPLLSDIDDVLNLSLIPDFESVGGIDEVLFDLSEIRALQEDVDAIHKRVRDNVQAAIWTQEYGRTLTGVPAKAPDNEHYLIALSTNPIKAGDFDKISLPDERETNPPNGSGGEPPSAPPNEPPPEPTQNRVGRPRIEDDPEARDLWEQAEALRKRHPAITNEQIAMRLTISVRTLQRYDAAFRELITA